MAGALSPPAAAIPACSPRRSTTTVGPSTALRHAPPPRPRRPRHPRRRPPRRPCPEANRAPCPPPCPPRPPSLPSSRFPCSTAPRCGSPAIPPRWTTSTGSSRSPTTKGRAPLHGRLARDGFAIDGSWSSQVLHTVYSYRRATPTARCMSPPTPAITNGTSCSPRLARHRGAGAAALARGSGRGAAGRLGGAAGTRPMTPPFGRTSSSTWRRSPPSSVSNRALSTTGQLRRPAWSNCTPGSPSPRRSASRWTTP